MLFSTVIVSFWVYWAIIVAAELNLEVTVGSELALPTISSPQAVVCAILRHEEQYIDEWLRYHQYVGFDSVHLYDNADVPSRYLASLDMVYGSFVTVTPFPGMQKQNAAYSHCANRLKKNNTWAAMLDADEFIVLRKHKSIKEFLTDVAPKGGSVVLNWATMGNNGVKTRGPGPVTSRFTYSTRELNRMVKSITYVDHSTWFSPHNGGVLPGYPKVDVLGRTVPNCDCDWANNTGCRGVAYLNHYFTKSLEEFVQKKHRGRAAKPGRGNPHNISMDEIKALFSVYSNPPHYEIEDTFARDFYLRHSLGYDVLAAHGKHAHHLSHPSAHGHGVV